MFKSIGRLKVVMSITSAKLSRVEEVDVRRARVFWETTVWTDPGPSCL